MYYVRQRGMVTGPHPVDHLQRMRTSGMLNPFDQISLDGQVWTTADRLLPQLFGLSPPRVPGTAGKGAGSLPPMLEPEVVEYWSYVDPATRQRKGPVTREDLADLIRTRIVRPATLVWQTGMAEWIPARRALPRMFPSSRVPWGVLLLSLAIVACLAIATWLLVRTLSGGSHPGALAQGAHLEQVSRAVAQLLAEKGSGSGFLVAPDLICTNHHVAGARGSLLKIYFQDDADRKNFEYTGEVVLVREKQDLALVRVTNGPVKIPFLQIGDEKGLRKGDTISVIGCPGIIFGGQLKNQLNKGSFSHSEGDEVYLDVSANPGNSGGPVVDAQGQVVGVLSAGQGTGNKDKPVLEGVCKARPGSQVADLLRQYEESLGRVR